MVSRPLWYWKLRPLQLADVIRYLLSDSVSTDVYTRVLEYTFNQPFKVAFHLDRARQGSPAALNQDDLGLSSRQYLALRLLTLASESGPRLEALLGYRKDTPGNSFNRLPLGFFWLIDGYGEGLRFSQKLLSCSGCDNWVAALALTQPLSLPVELLLPDLAKRGFYTGPAWLMKAAQDSEWSTGPGSVPEWGARASTVASIAADLTLSPQKLNTPLAVMTAAHLAPLWTGSTSDLRAAVQGILVTA